MNQRRTALLMLGVQGIAFGLYWPQAIPLILVLIALALIGHSRVLSFQLSAREEALLSLALGLPTFCWWFYYVRLAPGKTGIAGYVAVIRPSYSETAVISFFLMTLQVFQFFLKRERMSPRFVFYGALAMVGAGNVSRDFAFSTSYQYLSIAFLSLCACFSKCGERAAPRPTGRVLLPVLLLSWVTTTSMYAHRNTIHRLFNGIENSIREFASRIIVNRHPGFSAQGRLDEITNFHMGEQSEQIVVWMEVRRGPTPTYLRGMAFDHFDGREWHPASQPQEVDHNSWLGRQYHYDLVGGRWSALHAKKPNDLNQLRIRTDTDVARGHIFLPPRSEWLITSTRLALDANGIAWNPKPVIWPVRNATHIALHTFVSDRGIKLPRIEYSKDQWTAFGQAQLQVPLLDAEIHKLAGRLFENCTTAYDKRVAVMRYLRTHYKYSYFFFTPKGKDPFTHFLLERKAAHCEYFATAAALLLRLGGVRTRYVTGFAFPESAGGNTRFFRNRRAHAWVEALDPDLGWMTVEATPSYRRTTPPGRFEYWMARSEFWLMRFQDFYESHGVIGFLMLPLVFLWGLVISQAWPAQILKLFVVAACTIWLVRRYRRMVDAAEDEVGLALLSLLSRMDRKMKKHGAVRPPDQTLTQFAEVLKSVDALPSEMKSACAA